MKKFFGLYDKDEEEKLKEKLIGFTQIERKYVNFIHVSTKPEEFMHVTLIDDTRIKNKCDIVLFHGLSSSSLVYFKLFKKMSMHCRIYAVDLPGQGCSSRHDHLYKDANETEEYFLERIQVCFKKLHLKKFVLLGHSFGAYVASLFSLRFPEMINKLILLSPVGISSTYNDTSSTPFEDFCQKLFFKIEKPPAYMYQMLGWMANFVFNGVCDKNKIKGLQGVNYY